MKTVVKIHDAAMEEYEAWIARHSQPPTGSREMAKLLEAELFAELVRTKGEPAEVKRVECGELSHFHWRFSADTWVRFVLHEIPRSMFRKAGRKVVIISFSDSADE